MKNSETIVKLKIGTVLVWTVIYLCYTIWGNKYLESAGLVADARGYLYVSNVDTYRDEVRLQKRNPQGRVIWTRKYQGKHISHWENENTVITPSGIVYQIVGKLWENSAYLTVLCYDSDGHRRWIKDLYGIPYYKEKALDGNDLLIGGLDKNGLSFKIIRLTAQGTLMEPVFLYNPFNTSRVHYRVLANGLAIANRLPTGIKLSRLDYQGRNIATWELTANRLLSVTPDESFLMASQLQTGEIDKYSPAGQRLWNVKINSALPPYLKQIMKPEHLELDQDGNLYVAGLEQLYTTRRDYRTAFYNKGAHYQFEDRTFYRTRGGDRVFLAKINYQGQKLWLRSFITNQSHPVPRGLAVDRGGNVYLSGNFNFLNSRDNCFIAKYNARGKLLWVKRDVFLPTSVFCVLLAAIFLGISWIKKDRAWKFEFTALILMVVLFWGIEIF